MGPLLVGEGFVLRRGCRTGQPFSTAAGFRQSPRCHRPRRSHRRVLRVRDAGVRADARGTATTKADRGGADLQADQGGEAAGLRGARRAFRRAVPRFPGVLNSGPDPRFRPRGARHRSAGRAEARHPPADVHAHRDGGVRDTDGVGTRRRYARQTSDVDPRRRPRRAAHRPRQGAAAEYLQSRPVMPLRRRHPRADQPQETRRPRYRRRHGPESSG